MLQIVAKVQQYSHCSATMAKRKLVASSVPQLSQTLREITAERAGSMSEAERKDLHELLTIVAAALSEDESRKADAVKSAEAQRVAKRQRVAAASKDAGARLNLGALQCLKGDVAAKCIAFLRAEDFRSLAQIKCDEVSAGVLRSGVAMACDAIAPYASPPQLTLGTCGWEPLAVLEDAMARADAFFSSARRPWYDLLRVTAPGVVEHDDGEAAGIQEFDSSDDEGPVLTNQDFWRDMEEYCSLTDSAATVPRARWDQETTVVATLVEILRRAPDKLVRRVPRWPATWASQVLEMGVDVDEFVYRQGASRRQRKDNVVLLSAAGFAPALAHAIPRARRKDTLNALVDALLEPIKDPDDDSFESFLVEQSLLSGWRDAARVALVALLRSTRVEDSRDQQCKAVWRFIESFQSNEFALSTKSKVLSADDIWPAIVAEDPENSVIAWAVGQLDPAVVDGQDFRCHVTAMLDAMEYLADHIPAAAQVMLSLGTLEACARVRDSKDIRVSRYIADDLDSLHTTLMQATRPPEESRPYH